MERLQKLIKSRTVNLDPPSHFDKSNVDSIFGMMDPTKKGSISVEQYNAGEHSSTISSNSKPSNRLQSIPP